MVAKIIDGKKIAEKINTETSNEVRKKPDLKPHLAIILIGEKKESKIYIKLKEKKAEELNIQTSLYKFSVNSREEDIIDTINFLNHDQTVQSILVQLPLPKKFNTNKIISAIDPKKDVDRFHPNNFKRLITTCDHEEIMPPVLSAVLEILKETKLKIKGKKALIISNSDIFGNGLGKVLECCGAIVKKNNFKSTILEKNTLEADILISAIGQPKLIKGNMIKDNAVVIDIGITKLNNKIMGDVDLAEVSKKASYVTPVPGGIGPITVAMLLRNVFRLALKKY